MDWSRIARETIAEAHKRVPPDASFDDRKKIIDEAYPFGPREMWPYKAWLKARKAYLKAHDPSIPATPLFPGLRRDPISGRPIID